MVTNNILAFDASSAYCSCALEFEGSVFYENKLTNNSHADQILGIIDDLLKQAKTSLKEIDYIVVGKGPGSFTGVRIALSLALAFSMQDHIKLLAYDSIDILAYEEYFLKLHNKEIISIIDARMNEVYYSVYQQENEQLKSTDIIVTKPKNICFDEVLDDFVIVGNGFDIYEKEFEIKKNFSQNKNINYPKATTLITMAKNDIRLKQTQELTKIQASYVRNNVIHEKIQNFKKTIKS